MRQHFANRCFRRMLFAILTTLTASTAALAAPVVLFDNGGVVSSNTTWNDSYGFYEIYDDFVLSNSANITGIVYHIFTSPGTQYLSTYLSLFPGQLGSLEPSGALYDVSVAGTALANGLVSANRAVPTGYDVTISGLDWTVAAGTYTLGFSTSIYGGAAAIGSGNGASATIGPGALQIAGSNSVDEGTYLLVGDHVAFTVIGQQLQETAVPEPCSLALVGFGLAGFACARRLPSKGG